MNTLKKSGLLLLLVCLCACGREENLTAQNKPKQKTVKEALCRAWHLDLLARHKDYNSKDTFGIIFYTDYTFLLKIDPTAQEGITTIKGTWKFRNPLEGDFACYEEDGHCRSIVEIFFSTDKKIIDGYCYNMFNANKPSMVSIESNKLKLEPPRIAYDDMSLFIFSPTK